MFSFFKRKKEDKKKRGSHKERGTPKDMGVAAQRGDGKFAIPQGSSPLAAGSSVEARESSKAVLKNCNNCLLEESGHEIPLGAMGNDISKPISSLQGLTDIPFIEIDNIHDSLHTALVASDREDENCGQAQTSKCVSNVLSEPEVEKINELLIPEIEKTVVNDGGELIISSEECTIKEVETVTKIDKPSELESPSLVKKICELGNFEKSANSDFNNSAKSESVCEKYVSCDEALSTNETEDEKSVTDSVGTHNTDLARPGSVASCEEYSSDDIHNREEVSKTLLRLSSDEEQKPNEDMYKVTPYPQNFDNNGSLNCTEVFDKVKCSSEGNLYSYNKDCKIVKNNEGRKLCANEETEETDESSEEELSQSDQSESDNIVKNDSGCWDERENSVYFTKSDNQVSLSSAKGIINRKCKEKKHVKWADIDGKRKLTYEQECSAGSTENSSEDEETDDEEPAVKEQGEEEEEESEEEDDGENNDSNHSTKVKLIDKSEKNNWLESEPSSSEEESEDDGELNMDTTVVNLQLTEKSEDKSRDDETDSESTESEEESSTEESCDEDELKEEKKNPLVDIAEMQNRIADLQRDINLKSSNIDRLQVELDAACNESEMVRKRFKWLEADLDSYKQTNRELTERISISASQEVEKVERKSRQLEEAEKRIKELEAELNKVKSELVSLQASYKKLEADRDMEVQIIQKALEKALTDQEEMETKYEKEFENLRTLNSSREVQMLEDFEWKLREVQKICKKKMQDFEITNEKRNSELANKLAAAQADLEQISHLKLCEIELNQLKQTSSEQRKNLRLTNRKLEELQVSEKILQEEVNSLRTSLDKEKSHVATLQTIHREELIDRDRKAKLKSELQINQLTNEWDERLRRENLRTKTETEKTLWEEKNAAVELAKKSKDQEILQLKQSWEKKSQELKKEIEISKKKISEMEENHRTGFNKLQTNADRDIFDLRRKMDKLDMSYQEKIEKIQEQHEKELTALKEECDRRVQQSEANLQLQVGNSRTTIELVKQQLQNETQLKLEHLEHEYQKKLEQQWERLNEEKEQALEKLEQSHKHSLEILNTEMEKIKKQSKTEVEVQGKRKNLQLNQSSRTISSSQKKNSLSNEVAHSRNSISTRLDVAEVAEEIRMQGKEEVLQKSIEQLTKQLNAGKMEIEKLRQQLEARDNAKQQKTPPQPVPNSRRNRKPRSGRN